ncbi:MAG: SurA N-terminal domain-containing protein [Parvularculaceae bacterium]
MLKQVRSGLKTVGAWFVIVLLVLAFALWGVPELRNFTQRTPVSVGKVGFSQSQILSEYNRQMDYRRRAEDGKYSREQALADGLPDQVVDIIVTRSVLEQEAAKMGLAMPRSVIADYLKTNEQFRNPQSGEFDGTVLQQILDYNGWTASYFEALLRGDRLREQIVSSVSAGAPAPASLARGLLMRQIEARRVGYLTMTDDMAGAPEAPTPDGLNAYYEENKSAFMAPEYRTFTAVMLRLADFREGIEAPEEELRKIYGATKTRLYEVPERRTIYQVTYDAEAPAQAAAAALRQGKPFESVAEERGLTLEAVTLTEVKKTDIVDPNVAEANFASDLAEGAVIGPVKGVFGWTVAQIAAVIAPETQEFEEVRAAIAAQFTEQDARKRLFEVVEAIEESRDTGAPLAAAAQTAGATPVQFGPVDSFSFAPGGAIIADIPGDVLGEAFKLSEGEESEARELGDGEGYFFVQINEVTPPALRPYEDVSEDVDRRWRSEERNRRIAAAVKQVTDAVAAGSTFEEAAAPFNRAILALDIVRESTESAFSQALIDQIFKTDKGAVVSGASALGEAQVIVEVREIGFRQELVSPGYEAAWLQRLSFELNEELFEAYIEALRQEYGVKADPDLLAQLFNEGQ